VSELQDCALRNLLLEKSAEGIGIGKQSHDGRQLVDGQKADKHDQAIDTAILDQVVRQGDRPQQKDKE
jgi:hypothetical protein